MTLQTQKKNLLGLQYYLMQIMPMISKLGNLLLGTGDKISVDHVVVQSRDCDYDPAIYPTKYV